MSENEISWGGIGKHLVDAIEAGATDEEMKELAEEAISQIYAKFPGKDKDSATSRANSLKQIQRVVNKKYPRLENEALGYFFEPSGKGNLPKWRPKIYQWLKLESSDYDLTGDKSRAEWKAQKQAESQPKSNKKTTKKTTEKTANKLTEAMIIDTLNLDNETQSVLENALNQSGMNLNDFISKAILVYGKTLTGKAKKNKEDLSSVSTEELLNDAKYSTHPGRAEELVKRAIRAIKKYNAEVATEPKQRWIITTSLLNTLTGSRVETIKEIMAELKDDIDSHHAKYPQFFDEKKQLKTSFNRKRDNNKRSVNPEEEINFPELVPFGDE